MYWFELLYVGGENEGGISDWLRVRVERELKIYDLIEISFYVRSNI